MTTRENYLTALHHQKSEWVPCVLSDTYNCGFGASPGPWIEKGPLGGGYDGFGVRWVTPSSGGGAPIPASGEIILEDITQWKRVVRFPNIKAFDWQADAAQRLKDCSRENKVVDFGLGNGVFERIVTLMGFENALIAMFDEPEAYFSLASAIADYEIEIIKKVAQYYKPDTLTYYDDIASDKRLFMSEDAYRKLIKPHHARIAKAIRDQGIIPIQHTCGYMMPLVPDLIETGWQAWTSVQPVNDIVALQKKYSDKITFIGGYDTNGFPAISEDVAVIQSEVHRCIDTYGPQGSYILFGMLLVDSTDPHAIAKRMEPFIVEALRYAHEAANR